MQVLPVGKIIRINGKTNSKIKGMYLNMLPIGNFNEIQIISQFGSFIFCLIFKPLNQNKIRIG
jgi:hypothetical protein